jgi:pyruvate/2-oxoglutarate dehydrogenase complex dihydrolipoamide acyltransferase (E2) component
MTVRVRVKLPKIGMTMEEATIVRFCRQPGEAFRKGDPLYEIETEKISQEVEATGDGVMVEHAVPEGSDVRVGELVCVVEAHDISGVQGASPASQQGVAE